MTAVTEQVHPEWAAIPFYRKAWFNAVAMLVFIPVSLGLMASGPIYVRSKGTVMTLKRRDKIILGVLGTLVLLFNLAKLAGGDDADPNLAQGRLPACDSKVALNTLKDVAARKGDKIKEVMNVTDIQEREFRDWETARSDDQQICNTVARTSSGQKEFQYRMEWQDQAKGNWNLKAFWR
jgi:hypothetical protein